MVMPSQSHTKKTVTIRPGDELRDKVKVALEGIGSNMNAHVVGFLQWLVHETDELPERPPKPAEPTEDDQQ